MSKIELAPEAILQSQLDETLSKLDTAEIAMHKYRKQVEELQTKLSAVEKQLETEVNVCRKVQAEFDRLESRLCRVLGWRENDWPEGFDRRTAEMVADLARDSECGEPSKEGSPMSRETETT